MAPNFEAVRTIEQENGEDIHFFNEDITNTSIRNKKFKSICILSVQFFIEDESQ